MSIIEDVKNIFTFKLTENYGNFPEVINIDRKIYKNQLNKLPQLGILTKRVKKLKTNILMLHNNDSLSIFMSSHNIINYHLNIADNLQKQLKINYNIFGESSIKNILNFKG